jgi:hypothetical protein
MESPSRFFNTPDIIPRTLCRCQPVALAISSIVAPPGRFSSLIIVACFESSRLLLFEQGIFSLDFRLPLRNSLIPLYVIFLALFDVFHDLSPLVINGIIAVS